MRSTPVRLSIALAFASLIMSFSIMSAQQAPAEPVRTPAMQLSASQVQTPAAPRQTPSPVVIPPVRPQTAPVVTPFQQPLQVQPQPLRGFVDLHTHPMANLGFGGKFLYGGVDAAPGGGSLLPADPDCNHNVRATSEAQALGHDKSTHGGGAAASAAQGATTGAEVGAAIGTILPGAGTVAGAALGGAIGGAVGGTGGAVDNPCGDGIREQVIHAFQQDLPPANDPSGDAYGYPTFADWPKWNDLTHQKMWVDWIKRAHTGGLNVMVALAVNNKSLGDMTAGPGDYPTDDKTSADLQIAEIQSFVGRHADFMEVAYSSADVYRIVSASPPKLAVIIGMEIDHIGNFGVGRPNPATGGQYVYPAPPPYADVQAEVDRVWNEGVRYIFPIHLVDSAFGGSAAYISLFDASNVRESGHPWALVCANDVHDKLNGGFTYDNSGLGLLNTAVQLGKTGFAVTSIPSPQCPPGVGQRNSLGLTPSGVVAIKEMMRLGMLIDIDHMSEVSADQALQLACYGQYRPNTPPFTVPCPFGYPMNSGHNSVRGDTPTSFTERSLRPDQYALIGTLHGMAGVGSAQLGAASWLPLYNHIIQLMASDNTYSKTYTPIGYCPPVIGTVACGSVVAGFGTDTDGLEFGMPPPTLDPLDPSHGKNARYWLGLQYTSAFPASTDGNKTWDFNSEGVAHYGMLADFVQYLRLNLNRAMVDNNFMYGADYFYHTWQIAEQRSQCIGTGNQSNVFFIPACVNPPATPTSKIGPTATIANSSQLPNAVRSTGPTLMPMLSASVCLTSDGKNCLPPNTLAPPMGQVRHAIVVVSSGGQPVGGAAVSVSGQNGGVLTNTSGVGVVTYNGCIATTRSPLGLPVAMPAPCQGAAAKSGYQSVAISLP